MTTEGHSGHEVAGPLNADAMRWIQETEEECRRLLAQASSDSQRLREAGRAEMEEALTIAQRVRDEAEEYARNVKAEARIQYAQLSVELQQLRTELQQLLESSSGVLASMERARTTLEAEDHSVGQAQYTNPAQGTL